MLFSLVLKPPEQCRRQLLGRGGRGHKGGRKHDEGGAHLKIIVSDLLKIHVLTLQNARTGHAKNANNTKAIPFLI